MTPPAREPEPWSELPAAAAAAGGGFEMVSGGASDPRRAELVAKLTEFGILGAEAESLAQHATANNYKKMTVGSTNTVKQGKKIRESIVHFA